MEFLCRPGPLLLKGGFFAFLFTVRKTTLFHAGIEPRTVAIFLALTVSRSNHVAKFPPPLGYRSHLHSARSHPLLGYRSHSHSARSRPHSARSHPHSARSHSNSARSHPHSAIDLIHSRLDLIHCLLDFIHCLLDFIQFFPVFSGPVSLSQTKDLGDCGVLRWEWRCFWMSTSSASMVSSSL